MDVAINRKCTFYVSSICFIVKLKSNNAQMLTLIGNEVCCNYGDRFVAKHSTREGEGERYAEKASLMDSTMNV